MIKLKFNIDGIPISKNRPRFARRGKFTKTYSDQTEIQEYYKTVLSSQMGSVVPFQKGTPLILDCIFILPIPKSTSVKRFIKMINCAIMPTGAPDTDNLVKWVKDCCNKIVWHDDSQVVYESGFKKYGEDPRTILTIREFKTGGA